MNKGDHSILIDGTNYHIRKGRAQVGGVGYKLREGKTMVNGTVYPLEFTNYRSYIITFGQYSSVAEVNIYNNSLETEIAAWCDEDANIAVGAQSKVVRCEIYRKNASYPDPTLENYYYYKNNVTPTFNGLMNKQAAVGRYNVSYSRLTGDFLIFVTFDGYRTKDFDF